MSGGREATCEQSSLVCESASYDEVYPSGREPEEDLTWSPAREPSTHSSVEGEEGYDKEGDIEREERDEEKGGGDDNEGDGSDGGSEKYN